MYVDLRRKREKKTNYKKRLKYLKSKKYRIVIRRSNKYITIQLVKYEENGDKTLLSINSKMLSKVGWEGSFKNREAAYLSGYLFGMKCLKEDLKEGIIDLGLQNFNNKTGKLAAVIKGIKDSGMNIKVGFDLDKVILNRDKIMSFMNKLKEIV